MRDEAAAFYGENKSVGSCVVPRLVARRALQGIEGAIDLNRIDLVRGKFPFPHGGVTDQSVRAE